MRNFIYAFGAAAMMAIAFASCEEESETVPTQDNRDTTDPYIYNESKNMYGLYSKVVAGGKPVAFTYQEIWFKEVQGKKKSIEIPEFNYNGNTVPGFVINDVETVDENTLAKDFNVTDSNGGTHSGSIKYVNDEYIIHLTMSEKYSEISDELSFEFVPNMAQLLAGTYSGSLTYAIEGMKDTTISTSIELSLTTKKELSLIVPELEIATPLGSGKAGPFSMETRQEYSDAQISIINQDSKEGQEAEITIQGSCTPDGKLQIAFVVKPNDTGISVKGTFSNN